jgi:hypothetical protein
MLQNFIDDLKDTTGVALRMTSLAIAVAVSLFVTTSFLCAAAFVFVLQRSGLIFACLTGAGVFFLVTLIAAGCYLYRKRQIEKKPAETAKSAFATAMSDPMMVAAGLQIVRAVGFKRLVPLLLVGGVAFGLMSQRKSAEDQSPAE